MELETSSPTETEPIITIPIDVDPVEEQPFVLNAFGIFEGGGAKGLAHVGALRALEERGVNFIGIAGTSAGAIVAALVGARYKSEEMFDPVSKKPTGVFTTDFTTLLSRPKWVCFSFGRKIGQLWREHWSIRILLFSVILIGISLLLFALNYLFSALNHLLISWIPASWALLITFLVILLALWFVLGIANKRFRLFGYFSTSGFENWLNDRLKEKVPTQDPGGQVTFNDMPLPLTIVAADLNSKKIVTFNKKETPNFPVAKAVAASISIPGAFKPMVVGDKVLVDGGMLSNFPAWALDNEAETQIDIVPTFGFRLNPISLNDPKSFPPEKRKTFLGYAIALIRTAFLGENILEARQVLDLSQIPLSVSVGTLDFDLTDDQKRTLYREGKECADKFYRFDYIGPKDPRKINDLFEYLEKYIRLIINKPDVHLRINLALPIEPNRKKLRILYRRNMEDDFDDRLILGLEEGAIGRCWQSKDETVLVNMKEAAKTFETEWRMTKYQQRLVRSTLETLVSIPVFEPEILDKRGLNGEDMKLAVLSIDSDEDLENDFLPLSERDGKSELWPFVDLIRKDMATALRS